MFATLIGVIAVSATNALDGESKTSFEISKPPRPSVTMVINHGLTKDIHLNCTSKDGTYVTAIMTYSVAAETYCTPKNRCHKNATTAAVESCR